MRQCPHTILVVEDMVDEVFFMQRAFDQLGYGQRVRFVHNGEEAIEYLSGVGKYSDRQQFPLPCAVVTDLKMSLIDGFELLEWLRQHSHYKTIPAFALSSSELPADKRKAMACGATDYFAKPVVAGSLVLVLERVVSACSGSLSKCGATRLCDSGWNQNGSR
jgi:CheY-like chemotaxis protein